MFLWMKLLFLKKPYLSAIVDDAVFLRLFWIADGLGKKTL
jgi:hypothetical protein